MAGKFKMPNKKTTIIASIVVVILAIIAVAGTVMFLKDRGRTEAADLSDEQVSKEETSTTQETSDEQTTQSQTAENVGEQDGGETVEGATDTATDDTTAETTNSETTDEGTTTTTGTTTGGAVAGTTTTDTIQETTISRTEEVQIPEKQISEGHYVGWTPMQINAEMASANIVAQPTDLTIKKTAKIENGQNLVTRGEVITYEVSVKNNSEKELTGIEIKDKIPTMTEYKKDSVDNNGEEIIEGKTVVGLKWNIDLKAGEEKVVSFQVTVSKEATGKITNVAVVNGETTEPAETAVVTSTKTATIEGKEEGQPAEVGDKITYTITVVNTGDIAGKINVKDESLTKLVEDGILKIDEASEEVASKVMEGTLIDVPANGEGKISFTVVVEKIDGEIKNIATVGEEKVEETVDTVNITAEKSNTDVDNKVKSGDKFDYTIVLTNTGNTEGTTTVTDSIPEQLKVTGTNPKATINGNDVDFGNVKVKAGETKTLTISVEVKENATGDIKNVGKVDGEDVEDPEPIKTVNITGEKSNTDEDNKVKPGDTFDYTIVLTNSGSAEGTTTVTDSVPSQLEVTGTTPTATINGNDVDFGEVTVDSGATVTLTINVKVKENATGDIKNIGKVDGKDVEDPETIKTVNITAKKANTDVDNKVKPEDTFDYTIVLTNNGNTEGTTTVTDSIPEQLEVTGTTPTAIVNGNDVDFGEVTVKPGTPVTLTISVKVRENATGDIKNVAKVNGEDVEDPETIKTVNITGEKTNTDEDNKVKPGDKFDYTIVLTNSGSAEGTTTVTDSIPEQLKVIGTNPKATVNGNNVDFGNVKVNAGETKTLTISVEVKEDATGDIKNVGKVDGEDVEDPEPIKTVNITGEKTNTDEDNKVKPGDTFDYTIVLTNSGNIEGTTTVTDSVPSQLEITGTTSTATINGNDVDFGEVTVAPGTPVTLTINVKVRENATGDIKNVGKVDGKDVGDPETIKTVNITGEKSNTDADNKVKPGDTFNYTIKLTNSGNIEGITTVTDSIPEQLEVTGTTPTAIVNGNDVDFGEVTVKPGTPVTLTINVKVRENATGTFKNIALVGGEQTPDEDITIENVPKISATKTNNDEDKKVKPGDTVVYTIKLSNSGNAEGTTTVTDKLPAGVIYQSSSDNGVYNNGTVIWENVNVPIGTNSKELTVTVKIDKTATGRLENTAIVENETEHDEGLDLVKITANKSSNITTRTKVGQEVIYTITAVNNGTIAGDAVITDQIPDALEYKEATLTAAGEDTISESNGLVTWNVKDLEPGEENTRTLTIKATIKDFEGTLTTITNEVKVDGEKTSETTIEAGKPVITSAKTSEIISCPERNELTGTTVHEGDKIKYTITVNNTGTVEKEITVTDEIKSGLTYVDGTLNAEFAGVAVTGAKVENGVVKLENYTLTTGGTLTITFTVEVNKLPEGESSKTIDTNVAIVDGTQKEDEKGEYEVLKSIITSEKESSIESCAKVQTTGTIVHENDQIKYTIKVSNSGKTSGKVTVEDTIKEGLTYVEGTAKATVDNVAVPGVTVNNGKVTLTDYTLSAGKTIVIEFTAKVNPLPEGVYSKTIATNVAVVNGNDTTDTTGEYNVVKPNVESDKSSAIVECSVNQTTGRVVHENDKIRYTITVENNGTDSDVINVTDNIPIGVTYVDGTLSAKLNDNTEVPVTIEGRQVKLSAYTLVAGKTLTITFDVTVDALENGVYSKTIANNIAVVNGQNVPDDGGYEVQKPQIESSKVVDKATAEYNEELTYTITVKNLSTTASEVNVSDPIPVGTEYVPNSITVNENAVADSTYYKDGKVVYTGTLTEQNETVTITFKVKVTEKAIGKIITNTANINGEEKQASTKVVKKVTVGTESTKVTPIDLVLVLDVSGSMNNNGRLSDLQTSAKTLVNKVFADETTSTISVITYSSEVKSVNTYTYAQKTNLTKAIEGLTAKGGTNIYSALDQANTTVSGLGTEREKVVVFLTDGAPTIPSNLYIEGVHTENNSGSGYTNNIKNPIVQKADSLKALSGVKKVYSIGVGVNNLSDSTISYAEECTVTTLSENVTFDQTNHTFTVTLTNPTNSEITLEQVDVSFSNISKLLTAENGEIRGNNDTNARWQNVTITANESVTLTGTYEPSYDRWENERTPSASIDTGYEGVCTTEAHQEQFDGSALFSVVKEKNGKQYHCITTQDYAKYLLSKISSDGTSMNVDTVSTAFDKILHDISTTSKTYTVEDGTVIDIPETHTIISDVTVTIGDSSTPYTLDQLKAGVNGLVYEENVGFKWTITGDTLLTNKLSLEYKIEE